MTINGVLWRWRMMNAARDLHNQAVEDYAFALATLFPEGGTVVACDIERYVGWTVDRSDMEGILLRDPKTGIRERLLAGVEDNEFRRLKVRKEVR